MWPRYLLVALGLAALLQTGCADWSYDRVQLRQQVREYERLFPEGQSQRTDSTLCFFETGNLGRTDAIVLLLTRDRRVAGKLQATYVEHNYGFRVDTGYVLRGELDPALSELSATGPVDTLRAVADELTGGEADQFVRDAHGWVAAGLVRLVQRWPHAGDEGPAFPRLTAMLERVPADGTARITVDPRGVYLLEYTRGAVR